MRQTNVCSNRVFSPGFTQAHEGVKWRRKRRALKNNFTERKHFIRRYQRNGWMDLSELRAIDSLHNEGTVIREIFKVKKFSWVALTHEN